MSMSRRTSPSSWHCCCRYALCSQVREAGRRVSAQIIPRGRDISQRIQLLRIFFVVGCLDATSHIQFTLLYLSLQFIFFRELIFCFGIAQVWLLKDSHQNEGVGQLNCHFTEFFILFGTPPGFRWMHNQVWEQDWREKLGHNVLQVSVLPDSWRMLLGRPTCVTGSPLPRSVWVRVAAMPLISSP